MSYRHNYCRRFTTTIVAASIIAFGSLAHAQNLVVNPSFELGSFVNRGDGFMVLPAGSTNITGWTVVTDFIGWGTVPNSSGVNPIAPFNGSFFLDLQGDGIGGAPFGGVTQTLTTVIGQQYSFTFYLGTQEDATFGHGPVSVTATAGGTTLPFTFAPTGAGSQWGQFGFAFTASSTGTPITIQGTATSGGAYIGLELVSVSVVPEPSTATLLVGSALMVGLIRRKRRAISV